MQAASVDTSDLQAELLQKFDHINELIQQEHFTDAAKLLLELHYADLADFLDNNSRKVWQLILPELVEHLNPEVLVCVSDSNKQPMINVLGINASANLIDHLDIEDAIDVIEELDDELKQEIIAALSSPMRQQIIEGFKYPEGSAGRILEKDFIAISHHWTVGQAVDYIRRSVAKEQDFHGVIITDSRMRPVGTMLLSSLIKAERRQFVADLMNADYKVATTNTQINELAFIFKQYALTLVPIINKQGRLIGNISIANMLYIIEEQAESEYLQLGGVNKGDIFHNLYNTTKTRFPWLLVNLITACLTSLVINLFSDTIAKLITLATIMPIVASVGGNAGTQVMTVTVRALSNREINKSSNFRIISKELLACTLNGVLLAAIGSILTYMLFHSADLSGIFAASVIINFAVAGFLGSALPIVIHRLHMDPAAASGVLLTAFTDAIGFFTFLGLAYYFLL